MKKSRRIVQIVILLGVFILGGYAIGSAVFKSDEKPGRGSEPPAFSLVGLDGQVHKLDEYKGKGLVINFWGSWCEPCVKEMPLLEKTWKAMKDKNVEIIGVNVGEDELTVKNFVGQFGVDFPILLDKDKLTTKKYAIGPMPTTYFVNSKGKITDIYVGMLDENTLEERLKQLN